MGKDLVLPKNYIQGFILPWDDKNEVKNKVQIMSCYDMK